MMKLTNSILSELLGIPLSKIRRWTKEFIPPDPRATRRSGYTRELTANQSYYVILGGHFVTDFGWTYHQARTALEAIWPWMEKNGMVPEIPGWAKREGIDAAINKYEMMQFHFDLNSPDGNELLDISIVGVVSELEESNVYTDTLGRTYLRMKSERFMYYLVGNILIRHIEGSTQSIAKGGINFNPDHHLRLYLMRIFDPKQFVNWQKRFREIAKPY